MENQKQKKEEKDKQSFKANFYKSARYCYDGEQCPNKDTCKFKHGEYVGADIIKAAIEQETPGQDGSTATPSAIQIVFKGAKPKKEKKEKIFGINGP